MNYSIITFITNNYEPVRELLFKQDNVEYILVTDDKNLKSDTWKVVYEPLIDNDWMSGVAKAFIIRYNAHKYVSNDIFLRMDASIKIFESLDPIIDEFVENGFDISTMYHHSGRDFLQEYEAWEYDRNLDPKYRLKFKETAEKYGWDWNWRSGLCEIGFQICRKSDTLIDYFNDVLDYLFPTKQFFDCDHNDQCINTLFLMTKYNDKLKTWLMTNQIIGSKYAHIYHHKNENLDLYRDKFWEGYQFQYGYWRGEEKRLFFF